MPDTTPKSKAEKAIRQKNTSMSPEIATRIGEILTNIYSINSAMDRLSPTRDKSWDVLATAKNTLYCELGKIVREH